LWYVAVRKAGTLEVAGNHHAGRDYEARAEWAVALWRQHKLSHESFLRMSAEFREGHAKRKRDVDEVMRDEKAAATQGRVAAVLKALKGGGHLLPIRPFSDIDAFVAMFADPAMWRRPILVIVGATNTGKSMLAADVLRRVGRVVGAGGFVEVIVEKDMMLDFSDFDGETEAGVLLDGVGDVRVLQQNREALQGRPKLTKGGKSATMMYSFTFSLCRRAVVVTMDLSAKNLHLLKTDHWLRDPQNVRILRLQGPAWIGPAHEPVVSSGGLAGMRGWLPLRVTTWLEDLGSRAPARTFLDKGVTGADLCDMRLDDLEGGLRLLPWAAVKILQLRDEYLTGAGGF